MEPILLRFDELQYSSIETRLNSAAKALKPHFDAIQELSGISLTNEMVAELLDASNPTVTLNAVLGSIRESLSKSGIKIKYILDASIASATEDFYKIFNELRNTRSTYSGLSLPFALKWISNEFQVSAEYLNELRERLSVYVRTEEGAALREAHLKYFEAAKEFYNALPSRFKGLDKAISPLYEAGNVIPGIAPADWDYDYVINTYK